MFSKQDIEKYFLAEKQLGLLFIVIGSAAIILGVFLFFFYRTSFYKGAALPLVLIGCIQLIASIAVYKRSDDDRIRNVYAYDMNPSQLKNEELPRMQTVNKNFAAIIKVEMAFIVLGLALIFFFRTNPGQAFWYGFGITLVVQALIMLLADYSAEKRALQYTKGIESFVNRK